MSGKQGHENEKFNKDWNHKKTNSGTGEQNEMKNAIKSINSRMEQAAETIRKGE